jgi:hypothetical protein
MHGVSRRVGYRAAWDTAPHGWHTRPFFDAISACDGAALGTIILRLAPAQPHVPSAAAFVDEIARKCEAMRVSGNPANGPAGDASTWESR